MTALLAKVQKHENGGRYENGKCHAPLCALGDELESLIIPRFHRDDSGP